MSSKRIMFVSGDPNYFVRFRAPLVLDLHKAGHTLAVSCGVASAEVESALRALPLSYFPLDFKPRRFHLRAEQETIRGLRTAIESWNPDVIISFTPKMIAYTGRADSKLGERLFVAYFTGLGSSFIDNSVTSAPLNFVVHHLLRRALKQADRVIVQNEDDLAELKRRRILPSDSKYRVIPGSGVDTAYFAHQPPPANGFTVLCVGRLMREKGAHEFAKAAQIVKQQFPEVRFQWVGAPESNRIGISTAEQRAWQQSGLVELIGQVSDVRPYLQNCHVFALPSYREGTPRSALEAMSIGRAIIASDVPGCREVVEPNNNGFLVPARDGVALADAINKLIQDRKLMLQFGENSRRIALERFQVSAINRAVLEFLEL